MPPRRRSDPGLGSGSPRYPGTFLLALREAAAGMNWQVGRWVGDLVVCVDGAGQEHLVGLENLYRRARREPRETWPELIADFLSTVVTAHQDPGLPTNLAEVTDRLLVRVGHPLQKMPEAIQIFSQALPATDLVVNLVIDYPNRMCYVPAHLVADSGQPESHWVEVGLANLQARTPADCFQVIHEESGLRLCSVADAYDSSRALLLDKLLPEFRAHGYLVVLPGRDELLVLPVTARVFPHIHLLKVLAEKSHKSVPYPISDQVYWIHEGAWHHFAIDLRPQEAVLEPPPEFVAMMDRLGPLKKQDPGS